MDKKRHFYFGDKPSNADHREPHYNNSAFTVHRMANTLEITLELHNAAPSQELADIKFFVLCQGIGGEINKRDRIPSGLLDDLAIVATAGHPIMYWLRQPIPADPRGPWKMGPFTYTLPFGTDAFLLVATATASSAPPEGEPLTPPSKTADWAIWVSPLPEKC